MIRENIEIGKTVFHEMFGFGILKGFEDKEGMYKGFALVKFADYPGVSVIHRKKLTEIEEQEDLITDVGYRQDMTY